MSRFKLSVRSLFLIPETTYSCRHIQPMEILIEFSVVRKMAYNCCSFSKSRLRNSDSIYSLLGEGWLRVERGFNEVYPFQPSLNPH